IVWLLQYPAGPHVMAAQRAALPPLTALADRPATLRLFTEAAASQAPLAHLRTALPRPIWTSPRNQYPDWSGASPPPTLLPESSPTARPRPATRAAAAPPPPAHHPRYAPPPPAQTAWMSQPGR